MAETPATTTRQSPSEHVRRGRVYQPPVDIVETSEAFLLTADMPGVDEENVDVTLDERGLTIRGTVQSAGPEGYSLVRGEYGVGDYERTFTVSNEVDREGVEASMSDGVLRLKLPKAKQAVARKIKVSGK